MPINKNRLTTDHYAIVQKNIIEDQFFFTVSHTIETSTIELEWHDEFTKDDGFDDSECDGKYGIPLDLIAPEDLAEVFTQIAAERNGYLRSRLF